MRKENRKNKRLKCFIKKTLSKKAKRKKKLRQKTLKEKTFNLNFQKLIQSLFSKFAEKNNFQQFLSRAFFASYHLCSQYKFISYDSKIKYVYFIVVSCVYIYDFRCLIKRKTQNL